ncbi:unnamed protein product [Lepidochelys kempii]
MGKARSSLLCVLVACWMGSGTPADLHFLESPSNQTSSLGKDVRLRCAMQLSQELPEISWRRDGQVLELADSNQMQMPINDTVWLAISELSIPSVQLSDAGSYQCAMWVNGEEVLSDTAHLGLEGLPFFSEEPQDLEVAADTPFNLSCSAQGPPEPVRVIWLQDGAPPQLPGGPHGAGALHAGCERPEQNCLLLLRSPQCQGRGHLPDRGRDSGPPAAQEPGAGDAQRERPGGGLGAGGQRGHRPSASAQSRPCAQTRTSAPSPPRPCTTRTSTCRPSATSSRGWRPSPPTTSAWPAAAGLVPPAGPTGCPWRPWKGRPTTLRRTSRPSRTAPAPRYSGWSPAGRWAGSCVGTSWPIRAPIHPRWCWMWA